jgi:hypothetical protein
VIVVSRGGRPRYFGINNCFKGRGGTTQPPSFHKNSLSVGRIFFVGVTFPMDMEWRLRNFEEILRRINEILSVGLFWEF